MAKDLSGGSARAAGVPENDVAVVWTEDDRRCVLSWVGDRFRIRELRGFELVREQIGTDEGALLEVARRWQDERRGGAPSSGPQAVPPRDRQR